MLTKRLGLAVTITVLFAAGLAFADTVLQMNWLFSGTNIYSPTVLLDDGVYRMWYGGWQNSNQWDTQDLIYYRYSSDNLNWSSQTTVLTPAGVSPYAYHVNDPSVTKHFNTANGQWQYTMFFTVCVNSCTVQSDNEIWSATSADGINWFYPQVLLQGSSGPAEPSAIIDPQSDGTFWKVYYADRNDDTKIKMASVNGNRAAINTQVVYTISTGQAISSPEVRNVNGVWDLWFNVHLATEVDLYKTTSSSNTSWPSNYQVLIQNTGPSYCGTITPGVLPESSGQYNLYFGLTVRQPNGNCDLRYNQSIQKWLWQQ